MYSMMVMNWFAENDSAFEEQRTIVEKEFRLCSVEPESASFYIIDCCENIAWYQDLIHVKFMRALCEREREFETYEDEEMKNVPRDSDGSAKVALIGIDRSLAAWIRLDEQLSEKRVITHPMTTQLLKLQASIEGEFPDARMFVRPGFDQET